MTQILLDSGSLPPTPRFAWRTDREIRHESLWAITHRLCALNVLSEKEFQRYFSVSRKERNRHSGFCFRVSRTSHDLRSVAWLNLDALTAVISKEAIEQSVGGYFDIYRREDGVWPRSVADFLRFCPQCLAQGIHMYFYQFDCVLKCPVHGVELEATCRGCRRPIPYEVPGTKGPFRCGCGRVLWRPKRAADWRVSQTLRAELSAIGDWFRRQIDRHANHRFKFEYGGIGGFDPHDDEDLAPVQTWTPNVRIPTIWKVLAPRDAALAFHFDSEFAGRATTQIISLGSKPTPRRTRRDENLPDWGCPRGRCRGARRIYKAICRHFYRRRFRRHRRSIQAIARAYGGYYEGGAPRGLRLHPTFDAIAEAFVLWKCYWEWRHPDELYKSEREEVTWLWERHEKERYEECISPSFAESGAEEKNGDLEEQIHYRFVALRCLGTLEEILARIAAARETRCVDYLPIEMIDGRYVPTTITECLADRSVVITWFWPAERWLHSALFADWLKRIPTKKEVGAYARHMRRRRRGKLESWRFKWPEENPPRFFLASDDGTKIYGNHG